MVHRPCAAARTQGAADLWITGPATQAAGGDDRLPHQRWQGRSTQFMQSNQHSGERQGVWNTSGLAGAALDIVQGDRDGARCGPVGVPAAPSVRAPVETLCSEHLLPLAQPALPGRSSPGHRARRGSPWHCCPSLHSLRRSAEFVWGCP